MENVMDLTCSCLNVVNLINKKVMNMKDDFSKTGSTILKVSFAVFQ
jgi:hypothetical protein